MLYPQSAAPTLTPELFRAPSSEYRGAPFWSWNCRLDRGRLLRQIDCLKAMGMGGFHMHARVGLATEYMGEEFLGHIKACVEKARAEGMLAWLYDEDRWPSGFAGGLVTGEEDFRGKHLVLTTKAEPERGAPPHLAGPARLLATYAVRLQERCLAGYRRLTEGEAPGPGETVWRAFVRTVWTSPWFNNTAYVDTLSRPAIEKFLAVTHERYFQAVGRDFGGVVPAIFTDEPAFEPFRVLPNPESGNDVVMSWAADFPETYRARWGEDVLETLPELVWQLPEGRASRARWRYHDHNTERFASAFADTIGSWCDRHHLLFTGHMMEEQTLGSQTRMIGEAMRSYRGFSLPGIDLLCDALEFTTAKQSQSAARQFARPGVMSELYGVTGWDFDFAGHKRQGDWQAALGITVRVPHLSWVSMGGEAKRDYPAALDEHSPWYREYPLIENHFARLNTALTRGKAVVRVAVIHPIESFWLSWGPDDQTRMEREAREQAFQELTRWLLHDLIDFDFVAESLLPGLCPDQHGPRLTVGAMAYDVVLVPNLRTLRTTTLERLERLVADGGTVMFLGEAPELVDVQPHPGPARLAGRCPRLPMSKAAITTALAPWRELRISGRWGSEGLLHQLRQDGESRWLFLCNSSREHHGGLSVTLRGRWALSRWETLAGTQEAYAGWESAGDSAFYADLPPGSSLLLRLDPPGAAAAAAPARTGISWKERSRLSDPVPFSLDEPNVLLLDQAAWRLDGGAWEPCEEVLRLGQAVRARLGLPPQGGGMAQPWVHPPEPPSHRLGLRFTIEALAAVRAPRLALEGLAEARLRLDGQDLPVRPAGFWVDEAIACQQLPDLAVGSHLLEVELPFGRATPCEWAYLLGDFGVEVRGRHARLIALPTELAWGDWTRQGLPFYAGNLTYHARITGDGGPLALRLPQLRAPLVAAALDGVRIGEIAFAPYQLELGSPAPGEHRLDLTAFGCRINAFGALHHTNAQLRWCGPDAWRSQGDEWSYEYQLRPSGSLTAPRCLAPEVRESTNGSKPLHH